MGVVSGCGKQEVGVGGIYGCGSGCGCKEVYRFPHTTYPYSSCICSFLPIFKMFFILVPVLFVIKFYVLNNCSHSINTHTDNYGRPTGAI